MRLTLVSVRLVYLLVRNIQVFVVVNRMLTVFKRERERERHIFGSSPMIVKEGWWRVGHCHCRNVIGGGKSNDVLTKIARRGLRPNRILFRTSQNPPLFLQSITISHLVRTNQNSQLPNLKIKDLNVISRLFLKYIAF